MLSNQRPVRFVVEAQAEPAMLMRVISPFVRRDLDPDHVKSRRYGSTVRVDMRVEEMPPDMINAVEGSLRQIAGVVRVTVELQ
jgi:hypothetical protein